MSCANGSRKTVLHTHFPAVADEADLLENEWLRREAITFVPLACGSRHETN